MSFPININYEMGKHKNIIKNIKYEYKLLLCGETLGILCIENETNSKYINLIEPSDKIKLNDIDNFSLNIELNSFDFSYECNIDGIINKENQTSTFINDDIYVEFSSNQNGLTIASCCYKGNDKEKLFISPP